MSHIKFFKDISKNSVAEAGGKGASLGEMTQAKINVPPGFVVLAGAFDRFIEETKLKEEIKTRLAEVNINDTNSVDKASNVLRDVIADTLMPKDLEEEILRAFDGLCERDFSTSFRSARNDSQCLVAVRSSATAEDSAVASWAGELETYLNTTRENICDNVRKCWSSLFTPRAIFYRHEKKLIDHYVSVAVVVQKMVQSEISGIAFTVHPVTEDYDQMIIEAGYGLGEAIVSGQITPDSYVVSKSEMNIIDINIGAQTRKLIRNTKMVKPHITPPLGKGRKVKVILPLSGGGQGGDVSDDKSNEWVELGAEGEKQKLTSEQILEVAKVCKQIEDHYKFPCDIEWAMEKGKIYITQSRPITTLKK